MSRRAFSLVELSIVLVILGLLTGGILSGQALIKAAELRGVTTDMNRYMTALNTFRDKYFAMPGDMNNATMFWGTAAGTAGNDATCDAAMSASSIKTCNGDGNGQIENNGAIAYNERFYAWKDLANAGLIEGNYLGRSNSGSGSAGLTPGVDSPKPKMSGIAQTFAYTPATGNVTTAMNTIFYQGQTNNAPAFTAQDTWNIDTKLDDGKPGTGKLIMYLSTASPNCTTATTLPADYNLQGTGIACYLWIAIQ